LTVSGIRFKEVKTEDTGHKKKYMSVTVASTVEK
jgi:hypothetical protein